MKDSSTAKTRVALALAMAIFGTLAPFTRMINVSSGELALYRAIMASALIAIFLLIKREKIDFSAVKKDLLLLLISGAAMGFNWVLLFEAYKYTSISVATLSYYFAPVIVMIACPFLFREKLTKKQILCFVMSTVGLIMIIGVGGSVGERGVLGILFALGAAVLYATVILMNKSIKGVSGIVRTLMQFIGAIIILIPYVAFTSGVNLGGVDGTGWVCLLIVGVVHTGITYCLYFSSLKNLDGQSIAILSYIDPLVAVLISFFVLSEPLTPLQLVGGVLILGFTLYNELGNDKEKNETKK